MINKRVLFHFTHSSLMHNTTLFSSICFVLFSQALFSQTPTCPFPPPPGAESCFSTCVYCDLNGYVGINNGTPSGGNTVCGQIAIHNDQWFGFTAGSTSITITVTSSNCQNGDGLQIAFFDDCAAPDAVNCNSGTAGGGTTPLILTFDNFIIGKTYYLMIDGWSGDVCDFTIDITDGSISTSQPGTPAQPVGPTSVCPGAQVEYQIPEVDNAGFYQWSAPPGSSINGMGSSANIGAPEGSKVTITFGNTGGNVCVQAGNACNPISTQSCLVVTNQGIPPTNLPPLVVCNEDLPFVWSEAPYPTLSVVGTFNLSSVPYESFLGCDSLVRQTIVIKAPNFNNLDTVYICQGSCFQLGDSLLCNAGTYTEALTSYQGCDSIVSVTLVVIDPNVADIQAPQGQTITCTKPFLTLQSLNLPGTSHLWKNAAGDTLGTGNSIMVSTQGFYFHEVMASAGGVDCTAEGKILIKQNNTLPPVTATGGVLDAAHPTVQLMGSSILSGMTYQWTGPGGFTSNLKKPIVSVPGFYTLTVTNPQTGCSSSITVEVTMMI